MNGVASGDVATRLVASNMDPNVLRPWLGRNGQSFITMNGEGGKPVAYPVQNTALLRKDDWIHFDQAILRVAKNRLKIVQDFRGSNLEYTIPNGMSKTVLQYERISDINPATISMDGLRKSENDRPVFDMANLPLPIIHKDFSITLRQLLASRNGGSPLDTTMAELASRRVAEEAEKLFLGVSASYAFGGGVIYGLTNFPQRLTKAMTLPTAPGWSPQLHIEELLAMKQQSTDAYNYGPWGLYYSSAWDMYLDDDYSAAYPGITLRDRVKKISGFSEPMTLDYLPGYQTLLVQKASETARLVNGMNPTTVQWETDGGMVVHFKVMTILVPQVRCDMNNNTGIVHGVAA